MIVILQVAWGQDFFALRSSESGKMMANSANQAFPGRYQTSETETFSVILNMFQTLSFPFNNP